MRLLSYFTTTQIIKFWINIYNILIRSKNIYNAFFLLICIHFVIISLSEHIILLDICGSVFILKIQFDHYRQLGRPLNIFQLFIIDFAISPVYTNLIRFILSLTLIYYANQGCHWKMRLIIYVGIIFYKEIIGLLWFFFTNIIKLKNKAKENQ